MLLTGTTGASLFPTSDYPSGTFPPDAVVNGSQEVITKPSQQEQKRSILLLIIIIFPEDYVIDPNWAGNATLTYIQDHAGTESNAFFAADLE